MSRPRFSGVVWHGLPDDFPQSQLEAEYRRFLVLLSDRAEKQLHTGGFTAAAYRYRAMADYENDYLESSRHPDPDNLEASYQQDRALFGFLVNGLSSIEGFCFGLKAVMAWADQEVLDEKAQQRINPTAVSRKLTENWPNEALSRELSDLLKSDDYDEWKALRNQLAHRTAPFRDHTLVVGGDRSVKWRVGERRITLNENTTAERRRFLARRFQALSDALAAFNPKRNRAS